MGYSVDTILIDSRDRILDVAGYMDRSDLDDDGRTFFLYNQHDHSIDEIEHEENLTQWDDYNCEIPYGS